MKRKAIMNLALGALLFECVICLNHLTFWKSRKSSNLFSIYNEASLVMPTKPNVWVIGEVLVDLVPCRAGDNSIRVPFVGGGPATTARALCRLGLASFFLDGISTDEYGLMCRQVLLNDGVNLDLSFSSEKDTCLAIVSLDQKGSASYEFVINNTATFDFNSKWLPDLATAADKPSLLHVGTLATIVEPGASNLLEWAKKVTRSNDIPLVLDPNIRPAVLVDRYLYVAAVEKWLEISSVVKLSEDDIKWLYPKNIVELSVQAWLDRYCYMRLVVVTQGVNGLTAYTRNSRVYEPAESVTVVDTIGAGDTVGAVICEAIVNKQLMGVDGVIALETDLGYLRDTLRRAAKAAAICCSRAGAQPPTTEELGP